MYRWREHPVYLLAKGDLTLDDRPDLVITLAPGRGALVPVATVAG
jgi:hypothetical protein